MKRKEAKMTMSNRSISRGAGRLGVKALMAGALLAPAVLAAAETETGTKDDPIRTVAKLCERITAANATYKGKTLATTFYIAPGKYDVSATNMVSYAASGNVLDTSMTGHVSMTGYVLSGTTTNPRDVVIYGNRTERIFSLARAGLEYLTVSNGCPSGHGKWGGGVIARTASVSRHVVLTDCQATSSGGGSNGGSWYDCTYVNNKATVNSGGGACGGYYENCLFTNNTANSGGGAVYYGATLVNCTVVGNKAGGNGGGLLGFRISSAT